MVIPAKLLFSFPGLPLAYDLASFPFVTMAKHQIASALADLPSGSRVLDIGTGTGVIARHLAAKGFQVTGVDLSPEMLGRASALVREVDVNWLEGSAENLPVSGPYEAVVASYLLRHIPPEQISRVLSEMHRVLAPKGRLVLVDLQLPRPGPRQILGVWSLHSPEELIKLAGASGFRYQQHRYFPLSITQIFALDPVAQ